MDRPVEAILQMWTLAAIAFTLGFTGAWLRWGLRDEPVSN